MPLRETGTGGTVLLLHGATGPDSVTAITEHLADHHRVLTPTHPGWNDTPLSEDYGGVGDLADAYLRLLDRLEVTAAAVLTSSFGGWIAAEMCARDRERRLTRLLLLEVPQNQASAALARWASSAVRNCSGWSRCGAWPESGITISV